MAVDDTPHAQMEKKKNKGYVMGDISQVIKRMDRDLRISEGPRAGSSLSNPTKVRPDSGRLGCCTGTALLAPRCGLCSCGVRQRHMDTRGHSSTGTPMGMQASTPMGMQAMDLQAMGIPSTTAPGGPPVSLSQFLSEPVTQHYVTLPSSFNAMQSPMMTTDNSTIDFDQLAADLSATIPDTVSNDDRSRACCIRTSYCSSSLT